MTPKAVTAAQIRAGRALLKMEQRELAQRSGVSVPTIKRMEAGDGPVRGSYENVAKIVGVLEVAGVQFIPENGGGPGVRLREREQHQLGLAIDSDGTDQP